jgi:acyl-coenzyme A thioesterase PaaI-like protein
MAEFSEARLSAAEALRDLAHAVVAHDADDAALDRLTATARGAIREFQQAPRRARVIPRLDRLPEGEEGIEARRAVMADRGVGGAANPTGVEMISRREGDEAIAEVRFGPAFEGALGRVHGGMVAAVFDDVTGFVLAFVGEPGFTGRITVTYRAPVPVETTVEFRARQRERDGRKLYVDAEARLDGTLLATAEAMFIMVDHDHFATPAADLLETRERPI